MKKQKEPKRCWRIRGYDSLAPIFDQSVPTGQMTEGNMKELLRVCGSAKHLVGQDPNKCPWPDRSALIGVYNLLSEEVSPNDRNALGAVVTMASLAAVMKRPQQRLEFLGKRLAFDPHFEHNGKSTQLLLAFPLYVAMTS